MGICSGLLMRTRRAAIVKIVDHVHILVMKIVAALSEDCRSSRDHFFLFKLPTCYLGLSPRGRSLLKRGPAEPP